MRLVTRMRVLRTMQAAFLLGGAAWFLASGEVWLTIGLVAGALLQTTLEGYTWLASARALKRPFRTVRVRRFTADVPEGWSAEGDHGTGLHLSGGDAAITIVWHAKSAGFGRDPDLESMAISLLATHAKGRAEHDHEPCVGRLLGVDVPGRRAIFAGLELTIAEAYAVDVPIRSAIVSVLAVRSEAVPAALIRRCLESVTLREGGPSGSTIASHDVSGLAINVRPRPRPDQPTDDSTVAEA